jgi:protein phosphatase
MIPSQHSDLHLGHGTHPGESGKNNEDAYAVKVFRTLTGNHTATLAAVADGIGGHLAGEVASDLAVKSVIEVVAESADADYRAVLEQAVGRAARVVAERAQSDPEYQGMGTTLALALVVGRRLYTAYVGDSRLYLVRHQTIRQISVDHTWLEAAIEHGFITREEAKRHPNQHVVLRHLGKNPEMKGDFRLRLYHTETLEQAQQNQGLPLEPGDAVVVCSDGLSDLVEGEEILDTLVRNGDPQATVDELIALARSRGGHDNITVIVMQVPA